MGTVPSRRGGRHGLVRSPSWILVIDKRAEFFYSSRLVGWEPAGDGGGEDRGGGGVPGLPVFLPVGTHASWQRWLGDPDASWGRRRRSCRFTRRPPTASSFFPVPCVERSLRRIRPRCPTLRRLARGWRLLPADPPCSPVPSARHPSCGHLGGAGPPTQASPGGLSTKYSPGLALRRSEIGSHPVPSKRYGLNVGSSSWASQ